MNKNYFRIIMFIILIFSLSKITFDFFQLKKNEQKFKELHKIINIEKSRNPFKLLEEKNKNFKAWIKINGTNINYPVMQTKNDEEYYLFKNFENKYSPSGTPFLKANSNLDTNSQIIIFGHNMSDKTMFSDLIKYKNIEFYNKNKIIELYTSKQKLTYEIFSIFKINLSNKNEHFQFYNVNEFINERVYKDFVNEAIRISLYNTNKNPVFGEQILTLVTCDETSDSHRLIIMASSV